MVMAVVLLIYPTYLHKEYREFWEFVYLPSFQIDGICFSRLRSI